MAQDEKQILPHQKVTEAINLGTEKERREVKIRTTLSSAIMKELIDLFRKYSDVFTWSYQDIQDKDKITFLLNVFFNIQGQIRKLMINSQESNMYTKHFKIIFPRF